MSDPVLHVLAGPNGAGKTTFYRHYLAPVTYLRFVNADLIAADLWPDDPVGHSYDAAREAERQRAALIDARVSFVAETVFSHPSKLDLLTTAHVAGYLVTLHVLAVPVELAVARVPNRVAHGGHHVPEDKIRGRYDRLWAHVAAAVAVADEAYVYDNSQFNRRFRRIAHYRNGRPLSAPNWPAWIPVELRTAGHPPAR